MVRVKGQKTEGSSQGEFPSNSSGNDRSVERYQSLYTNIKSQREEIHGTRDKVQKTGVPT